MSDIKIESSGVFEKMDDAKLLATYNRICGTDDQRLPASREDTIQRMLKVLSLKPPPRKAKKVGGKPVGRPHARFSLLPKPGPKRLVRAGTRRDVTLELCRNGTTIETVMRATGASMKDAYNDIRLLHVDLGYGIREDENGNIEVYE